MVSLLLAFVLAHAGRISEQEALMKAKSFMPGKHFEISNVKLTRSNLSNQTLKNLYVFNVEDGEGFVVVSSDDRTPSILGYSNTGGLDVGHLPCNVKWLLSYYDTAIGLLKDDFKPSCNKIRSTEMNIEIPAIVDTQWGQGDPYNALCPMHEGERCKTGCVATAMAQVMNHNRWPQSKTADVPQYVTEQLGISMPALSGKQFNWDNMTNSSIAELMLYCGQSVKMDYTTTGSGAMNNRVPEAMKDIFGYSTATNLVTRGSYSEEQWADMIYKELKEGYPVLYFGQSETDGGHAFIIDGYADGKYHINWGWNGWCNGYFTLDELNPYMINGFNQSQEMVINAWRQAGEEDTSRPKTVVTEITTGKRLLERTTTGEAFPPFTVTTVVNSDMNSDATIQTGLALYDDNGLIEVLAQDSHDFTAVESYVANREVIISADIQSGEYRIVSVNRINDNDNWLRDQGSTERYIAVTVAETSLKLQPMPMDEDEKNTIDYGVHTIDGITYQLKYKWHIWGRNYAYVLPYNKNEKYKGDIYIPDYVNYQNMEFKIIDYGDEHIFRKSPELTSISSPITLFVRDCPMLKSIDIREGVVNMGEKNGWSYIQGNISNCPLLESIIFPSTCGSIELPENCQNLKTLTILYKKGLTIKNWKEKERLTEESLPSLTDIYISSDVPPTMEGIIEAVNPKVTIHVPQGSLENYKHSGWKDWNIVEDRATVPVQVAIDYCGPIRKIPNIAFCCNYSCDGDGDMEAAIRIPAEHLAAYKGCRISSMEYWIDYLDDVDYVFITERGKDYVIKQKVKSIGGAWTEVKFSQPYTITGEELFVGIGKRGTLQAPFGNMDIAEDGMWTRRMGKETPFGKPGEWEKYDGNNEYAHPLPIRAFIDGENLPDDIAFSNIQIDESENAENYKRQAKVPTMSDATSRKSFAFRISDEGKSSATDAIQPIKAVTATDESTGKKTASFKVRNRSMRTVRQITLDPYIDGIQQSPITIDTYLPTNWEDNVTIDLANNLPGRNHTMTFNVADIDGKPDAVPANSYGEVNFKNTTATYFPRKIVMEEATGTWCGWCPRGMATIEKMSEQYPDNFIAIAIHQDKQMSPDESYKPFLDKVESYPSAHINRMDWIDPTPFDLEDVKDKAVAKVTSIIKSISSNQVEIETEAVFGFSDNGTSEYRLAYVVTEDGVGPYLQANFYSDPTAEDNPDDLMNWWVHQSSPIPITFNEVARAIYDYYGLEGLLPKEVSEGETYKTKYTLTMPDNVNNLINVKIVTLLLDTKSGEILNADRCTLTDVPETGISEVTTADNKCFDIYNTLGMKVRTKASSAKGLRKGLYIINGKKISIR